MCSVKREYKKPLTVIIYSMQVTLDVNCTFNLQCAITYGEIGKLTAVVIVVWLN